MSDPWSWVAAERRSTADLFEGLDAAQLATPSLCDGWTVKHVLAHLTMQLDFAPTEFFPAFVRSGLRFPKAIVALTATRAERPTADLVAIMRDRADKHWNPPGLGVDAPLTDQLVHGVDARFPLGLSHVPDPAAVRRCLGFVSTRKATLGTFSRSGASEGLRLEAPDVDWSHGEGPTVAGPGVLVLAALCDRPAVLDQLSGDGVAVLRHRLG